MIDASEVPQTQVEKRKESLAETQRLQTLYQEEATTRGLEITANMWTIADEVISPDRLKSEQPSQVINQENGKFIKNTYDSSIFQTQAQTRYLVEELPRGKGGMAEVYKAWDAKLNRLVAIKVPLANDQVTDQLELLQREAIAQGRMKNASLEVFDFLRSEKGPVIVMEWVDETQGNLNTAIEKGLSIAEIKTILSSLTEVLQQLRDQGVQHRDIKPDNIFLTENGEVKLADFGVASNVRNNGDNITGTPSYMAPETLNGETENPTTDVFITGLILYKMLTGKELLEGNNLSEIVDSMNNNLLIESIENKLTENWLGERLSDNQLKDIALVIFRAIQFDSASRFRTVKELVEDFYMAVGSN